jgi:hypothetical protein
MLLNCGGEGDMSVWWRWVDAAFELAVALVSAPVGE